MMYTAALTYFQESRVSHCKYWILLTGLAIEDL